MGTIYDEDGITPLIGYPVTATSITHGGSTSDTTDSSGKYSIDLQNISTCEDGDLIEINVSKSHHTGSSTFTLDLGSGFKTINIITHINIIDGETLRIYYSCNKYPNYYIDCDASRWDETNYDITIETFLRKTNRNKLFNNLVPGAVGELYEILGKSVFKDSTYSSGNTLILHPLDGTGLSGLREDRTIAVKSISDTFVTKDLFNVKIEGKRLNA